MISFPKDCNHDQIMISILLLHGILLNILKIYFFYDKAYKIYMKVKSSQVRRPSLPSQTLYLTHF